MLTYNLIKNNLDLSKKIYIAFSGGPDSTALLHLISKMKTKRITFLRKEKEAKWRNRMNQDEKTAIAKKMSKCLFVRGDTVHGTHC